MSLISWLLANREYSENKITVKILPPADTNDFDCTDISFHANLNKVHMENTAVVFAESMSCCYTYICTKIVTMCVCVCVSSIYSGASDKLGSGPVSFIQRLSLVGRFTIFTPKIIHVQCSFQFISRPMSFSL